MANGSGALHFTEVGPRDGLQNLRETVATDDKVELVTRLLRTGVDQVEATSFVSPRWVPQLADAAEVLSRVRQELPSEWQRVRVLVPNRHGLERAAEAGVVRVLANVGATDSFNRRNLNHSVAETLNEISQMVLEGARAGVRIDADLSVAFGCPFDGPVAPAAVRDICLGLLELGADEIGVADTIGVADPAQVERMVTQLLEAGIPLDRLSLHFHDTRGMGLANAFAAYRLGVRRFEGSVAGIGGCPFAPRSTGNICSEDLLFLLEREGAVAAAVVDKLCEVSSWLETRLGRELPGRLYRAGRWPARS